MTSRAVIRAAVALLLAAVAIGETFSQSAAQLYSVDENLNQAAAVSLFTRGDYSANAMRFDPAISSGIASTWIFGVVHTAGGTLYLARLLDGLAQLLAGVGLLAAFVRGRGFGRDQALVAALTVAVMLQLVLAHANRLTASGELWGVLFLSGAIYLATRRPALAALGAGVAAWWCKPVFIPFGVAAILCNARATRTPLRTLVPWFLTPLVLWVGLIAVRHDAGTALSWLFTSADFVIRHSTGYVVDTFDRLPRIEGWFFAVPAGGRLVDEPWQAMMPLYVALGAGTVLTLLRWGLIRTHGRGQPHLCVALLLGAGYVGWCFLADPTPSARHLLPAAYIAIGAGFYSLVDLLAASSGWQPRIIGGLIVIIALPLVAEAAGRTYEGLELMRWRASHAKACRGADVLKPPCNQYRSAIALFKAVNRACGIPLGTLDDQCMRDHRSELIESIRELLREDSESSSYSAAFLLLVMQHRIYRERVDFDTDLQSLVCERDERFNRYFSDAGLNIPALVANCS